jgi:hypothetical protein
MNYLKILKSAAKAMAAAVAVSDPSDNPQKPKKDKSSDLTALGEAPGQVFPTIRALGATADPVVHTGPGMPTAPAAKLDMAQILKFNPFHGEGGLFSDGGDSTKFVSTGPKFSGFLKNVRGTYTGPNRGGGYSGKVAAGIQKTLGLPKNPDHRQVTGVSSHTVDANARTRQQFVDNKATIHSVLSMNGFRTGGQRFEGKEDVVTHYKHPNGATATVMHMDQNLPAASRWIGVDIQHNQSPKAKKEDDQEVLSVHHLKKVEGGWECHVAKNDAYGDVYQHEESGQVVIITLEGCDSQAISAAHTAFTDAGWTYFK